jgi:hypothetical protein
MKHRTRYCKQACMQAVLRVSVGCEDVYVGGELRRWKEAGDRRVYVTSRHVPMCLQSAGMWLVCRDALVARVALVQHL